MGKGKTPKPPVPAQGSRRRTCPPRGATIKLESPVPEMSSQNLSEELEIADKIAVPVSSKRTKSREVQPQPGPSRLSKPFQVVINYIPSPSPSTASISTVNKGKEQCYSPPEISSHENDPLSLESPESESIEEDAPNSPQQILPDADEYIEELVYVDLDEIPNIQELFSIRPDDHLLLQNRRQREKPFVPKPTVSDVTLKFYNLESDKPVLRLGKTFFTGRWLDSVGSSLFFNKKDKSSLKRKEFEFVHLMTEGKNNNLDDLIPNKLDQSSDENIISPDPVFKEKESLTPFGLVANVKKILKLTRRDLSGAEASSSARVIHDDARFMPSFYIDKEMRNKVEILQLLGKHSPKDFKFKWKLQKGQDDSAPTEVKRRERNEDSDWEDISESDLSEDEGSSSSCDEVDEEAYEAYLKIREELNYETKNFNFNNKKSKLVETSEAFKERYSAPYYLNRKRVVTRVNSMLTRANMKKINYASTNYRRKKVPIVPIDITIRNEGSSEITSENHSHLNATDSNPQLPTVITLKNRNERFYKPIFRSREELLQKWKPTFNPNSSLKSTTTRLTLPEELKELIGEVNATNESDKAEEASESLKSLTVSESKHSESTE